MKKADLLKAALEIVEKRGLNYGKPENNFKRIAEFWEDYLNNRESTSGFDTYCPVTEADVAAMMVLMKVARLMEKPDHLDSWQDIAGYAACGAEVSLAGEEPGALRGTSREMNMTITSVDLGVAFNDALDDLAKPVFDKLVETLDEPGTAVIHGYDADNQPMSEVVQLTPKAPIFKPGDAVVPRWVTKTNFHGTVDRVENGYVYLTWRRIDMPDEPPWTSMARPRDLELAALKDIPPPVAKEAEFSKHVIFANPVQTKVGGEPL